jgi:hypothetical protein
MKTVTALSYLLVAIAFCQGLADKVKAQSPPQTAVADKVPITPDLFNTIQTRQLAELTVALTNSDVVGTLRHLLYPGSNVPPVAAVIYPFHNVTGGVKLLAVPLPLLRYVPTNRSIELSASMDQLSQAYPLSAEESSTPITEATGREIFSRFGVDWASRNSDPSAPNIVEKVKRDIEEGGMPRERLGGTPSIPARTFPVATVYGAGTLALLLLGIGFVLRKGGRRRGVGPPGDASGEGLERLDWKAALFAGLVAGTVTFLLPRGNPWGPGSFVVPTVLGRGLPAGSEINFGTGLLIHFALSVFYAFILSFIIYRLTWKFSVLLAGITALGFYFMNVMYVRLVVPSLLGAEWGVVLVHLLFGLVAASCYRGWLETHPQERMPKPA